MKHFKFRYIWTVIVSMMVLFPFGGYGQVLRKISLSYETGDFRFVDVDSICYIECLSNTAVLKEDTLAPALPFICANVMIGSNEEYQGFSVDDGELLIREDVNIARNPNLCFSNNTVPSDRQEKTNFINDVYPETQIEYTGTHEAGGYRYLTFLVCPFRYTAYNKKLYLKSHIVINLQLSTSEQSLTRNKRTLDGYSTNILNSNFFVNKEDANRLYGIVKEEKGRNVLSIENQPYKYLVITSNSLKDEFQRLANWKNVKGVRTKLLTVEDVYSQDSTSGRTNAQKIKRAIKGYHLTHNIEYVLLGGGADIVPVQHCYLPNDGGSTALAFNTPADVYYSCLADIEWDKNKNGLVGETSDTINLDQDIAVTRLPARTVNEAKTMIDRIIAYEKAFDTSKWNDSILLSAVVTARYDTLNNGRIMSDAEGQGRILYDQCIHSYGNDNVFFFFDTYTDRMDSCYYDVTNTNLQYELSKGYSFVNMSTHGYKMGWSMENGSWYDTAYAARLPNPHYTIINNAASCSTNFFDWYDNCLGEKFLKNQNSGILAYYGSSRDAIGSNNPYSLAADMIYAGELFKNIFGFENGISLGCALRNSKMAVSAAHNLTRSYRWMFFTLNMFGDSEMPIYKTCPSNFQNIKVNYNGDFMQVTGHEPYSYLCLMSRFDNGQSLYFNDYYNSQAPNGGLNFRYLEDEYTFCLTKAGFIPYYAILGDTVHLQNENFIGNNKIIGNSQVLIGSNVTDKTDGGNVVIETGNTIVSCHNEVTILDSFEVKPGASFEININPTYSYE